jgi:MFS family permease
MVIAGVVTLSAEISPPSCRGRFMTLVASCYTLGFLYTSLWALVIFQAGSGSWRWFMFMNVLPTIVALSLVVMFVPESPRKSN